MKTCSCCGLEKEEAQFYENKAASDDLNTQCSSCLQEKRRVGKTTKRKVTSQQSRLKREYGITAEDYLATLKAQKGCCAICGRHHTEFKIALAVDHNHKTGKNRGLLCSACNTALGFLNEDTHTIRMMIKYLLDYS